MAGNSFAELRAGDKVDTLVAVLKSEVGTTKKGAKFLKVSVSDTSGVSLVAKQWDATELEIEESKGMCWAWVTGEAGTYEGALEITLDKKQRLYSVDEPENSSAFIPSSALSIADLRGRLRAYIESVRQPQLNALLRAVFIEDKTLARPFEVLPAAETRHHAFRHGLIQHTLEVTDVVDAICAKHQNWGQSRGRLSRDLAITGALLHDIGKIEEYQQDGHGICYSTVGGLLGHVTLGVIRLARKIAPIRKAIGFEQELEDVILHMIVSHHGKTEYGAPVPPMSAEAALIHYADVVSTECFYFAEAQAQAEEGVAISKQWKLDDHGRHVYVAKLDAIWGEQLKAEGTDLPDGFSWSAGTVPSANDLSLPVNILTLPLLRLASSAPENNFVTARLPLVGQIAAGVPILDSANIEEEVYVEAGGLGLGKGAYYLLRVQGDSMIGDGILDHDLIVVRYQDEAMWGDIVVADLEDQGATVKRLVNKDGQVQLEASNPAYDPIIIPDPTTLRIQGRVIAVAR